MTRKWTDREIEDYVMRLKPPLGEADPVEAQVETPRISDSFDRQVPSYNADDDWNRWAQIHRDHEWEHRVKPALAAFEDAIVYVCLIGRGDMNFFLFSQNLRAAAAEKNFLL
jgi:hypothetical protein